MGLRRAFNLYIPTLHGSLNLVTHLKASLCLWSGRLSVRVHREEGGPARCWADEVQGPDEEDEGRALKGSPSSLVWFILSNVAMVLCPNTAVCLSPLLEHGETEGHESFKAEENVSRHSWRAHILSPAEMLKWLELVNKHHTSNRLSLIIQM